MKEDNHMTCEVCHKEIGNVGYAVSVNHEPIHGCKECMVIVEQLIKEETMIPDKPFIRVDYKEFEPDTYWGVVVELVDGTEDIFFSEDFKGDLAHAMNKYPDHHMRSSVTQFISDAGLKEEK
jgi:hypothetical protein